MQSIWKWLTIVEGSGRITIALLVAEAATHVQSYSHELLFIIEPGDSKSVIVIQMALACSSNGAEFFLANRVLPDGGSNVVHFEENPAAFTSMILRCSASFRALEILRPSRLNYIYLSSIG